jgi:hypothetical protein
MNKNKDWVSAVIIDDDDSDKEVLEVKKVVKVGVSVDHRVLTIESELTKKSSGSNLLNDIFYNLNYCFIN